MIFVLLVLIASLILFAVCMPRKHAKEEVITCIMITGKDDARMEFAKRSIANFTSQTYQNKQLLILNHHDTIKLTDNKHPSIYEFKITKNDSLNLGDMRNMALEMVPLNGLFVPWDDDDYRNPQFLSILYKHLVQNQSDLVAIQNRYEINLQNEFVWRSVMKSGFVHVLARRKPEINYLSRQSMEDLDLISDYKKNKYRVNQLNSDPILYIRMVHDTNTSLYVDSKKHEIDKKYVISRSNYQEWEVDAITKNKIVDIIKQNADH